MQINDDDDDDESGCNIAATYSPFSLPSLPLPSVPFTSRTHHQIAARRSRGALKLPQRVRAEPGRQMHWALENASMVLLCDRFTYSIAGHVTTNEEVIASSCLNVTEKDKQV